jgi:Ca2+-binding EF-hand superfamily protein
MTKRMVALAFVWAVTTPALAEQDPFKTLDYDRDGLLSWEEVHMLGWSRGRFDVEDMDRDGKVSPADRAARAKWLARPAQNARIVRAMDQSRDGRIQREEWWWSPEDWKRADLDRDGNLDASELARLPKVEDPRPNRPADPDLRDPD